MSSAAEILQKVTGLEPVKKYGRMVVTFGPYLLAARDSFEVDDGGAAAAPGVIISYSPNEGQSFTDLTGLVSPDQAEAALQKFITADHDVEIAIRAPGSIWNDYTVTVYPVGSIFRWGARGNAKELSRDTFLSIQAAAFDLKVSAALVPAEKYGELLGKVKFVPGDMDTRGWTYNGVTYRNIFYAMKAAHEGTAGLTALGGLPGQWVVVDLPFLYYDDENAYVFRNLPFPDLTEKEKEVFGVSAEDLDPLVMETFNAKHPLAIIEAEVEEELRKRYEEEGKYGEVYMPEFQAVVDEEVAARLEAPEHAAAKEAKATRDRLSEIIKWRDAQPEMVAYYAEVDRLSAIGDDRPTLKSMGKVQPGVQIETADGRKFLIGDINTDGTDYGGHEAVQPTAIIHRYRVLVPPNKLD